jgi:phage shock protein C
MSMWTAIVMIVLISVAGGVASNFARARSKMAQRDLLQNNSGETVAEIEALKRRIEVLEKIVTDQKYDLRREIEQLERTG